MPNQEIGIMKTDYSQVYRRRITESQRRYGYLGFSCPGFRLVIHGDWNDKTKSNIRLPVGIVNNISKSTMSVLIPWFSFMKFPVSEI